ncbi:MAG TPA: cupin domain-containing protein [Geminicoccus sp.]|jgi:oxalate decarboxylase|uniref:cupin domain-containing protein n=1 Tax=Geminicoccus sp. TaxID=2024832 RepID=UPI002E3442B4|nr:cupin domain-containing protein [Geminicoccus sp.]HEX2529191.1 cupin domain-containing protein [Geminicoccus sp.]
MGTRSRRDVLAIGAAGSFALTTAAEAAGFGNPDAPAEGALNSTPGALSDPGPQDQATTDQLPSFESPPPTDVGGMPTFWSSFNIAPKRIQAGGWARQMTTESFPISKAMSGVNMRLGPGGIRELHWHLAAEWAIVTNGRCRVTVLDTEGRAFVEDVGEGDLWYFPPGLPHSLQCLGADGCEFVIVFDDGSASEYNTLPMTDWLAHTPPKVLGQNFGLPPDAFQNIPLNNLWIFQGKESGSLEVDRAAVAAGGASTQGFTFGLASSQPVRESEAGSIRLADSRTFKISTTIAAALQVIKPGALRQMHWHPNADEWQYWMKGQGRMTVFDAGPRAQTADFHPGDIGYVPRGHGHYIENTGQEDLHVVTVFKAPEYQDLSNWLARTPPELVAQHLNMDIAVVRTFQATRYGIQAAVPKAG